MRDTPSLWGAVGVAAVCVAGATQPVPDKTVVLTFDDAVRSHLTVVAPLLREYGFQATFFVSHAFLNDREHFLSWEEIAELHEMGFEVGNHSWTHSNFGSPKMAARLAGELALVENELAKVDVPKPVSFAWPGNGFGTEAVRVLQACGYRFARRGMQPEVAYGEVKPGPVYHPQAHHPLLIPTTGDAYPDWDLDAFKRVVDLAKNGNIVVLQFHGVPDEAHPWVHTPPERFRESVAYLKEAGFNAVALRDLARYIDPDAQVSDPMQWVRYVPGQPSLELPAEVVATRADLGYWLKNMVGHHRFSVEEAAVACGYPVTVMEQKLDAFGPLQPPDDPAGFLKVLPYPGGRHPRKGFLEGAINPLRGTKVSVFPPWDDGGYVVADLPEAIWSNLGLTFLAHTHIPTIWDDANIVQENVDWKRLPSGELEHEYRLPNGIQFGARVKPQADLVRLELWLENGTDETLTDLRAQICIMLAGATGFDYVSNEGKRLENGVAAAASTDGGRWVLVAFEDCVRPWANPPVPCIHSDPALADAAPGERVRVTGRLWFYEGSNPDNEIARIENGP
jgi:peptidoglycan/xylan/chitin deacetylase (PgdA/CDA1 family)